MVGVYVEDTERPCTLQHAVDVLNFFLRKSRFLFKMKQQE